MVGQVSAVAAGKISGMGLTQVYIYVYLTSYFAVAFSQALLEMHKKEHVKY